MSELTDRMRTCATCIRTVRTAPERHVLNDAAELLFSAANEIELLSGPIDLGEPMEILPPVTVVPPTKTEPTLAGAWVDSNSALPVANPYRSANTCPQCDSRSAKTVHREGKRFVLECPACGHKWWKR